jgi:hypothetical protein
VDGGETEREKVLSMQMSTHVPDNRCVERRRPLSSPSSRPPLRASLEPEPADVSAGGWVAPGMSAPGSGGSNFLSGTCTCACARDVRSSPELGSGRTSTESHPNVPRPITRTAKTSNAPADHPSFRRAFPSFQTGRTSRRRRRRTCPTWTAWRASQSPRGRP